MKIRFTPAKENNPDSEHGLKVAYGLAKRSGYKIRWLLILFIVISPIVFAVWQWLCNDVLITAPGIITTEVIEVGSPYKGIIDEIYVKKGEKVSNKQLLLKINNTLLNSRIKKLQEQYKLLDKNTLENSNNILSKQKQIIELNKANVEDQQKLVEQYKQFVKKGVVSLEETSTITQSYYNARIQLQNAYMKYQKYINLQNIELKTGPIVAKKAELELHIEEAIAQQEMLKVQANMKASVVDILVKPGVMVTEGQSLLLLSQRKEPIVHAFLDPKYIEKARPGSQVTILMPDGKSVLGEVSNQVNLTTRLRSTLASPFDNNKQVLKVEIALLEQLPPGLYIENLPVRVKFPLLFNR
ncbi:HlyD family secretion protein [Spartinivicinus ruber]|uniref:HlyD family secretion protein n=1 Tax=Spartinivicinus ruber TaxID=2683272 RepID=UPI0013D838EA|nr:hypothetical protein [Spartinivicinus ruber]